MSEFEGRISVVTGAGWAALVKTVRYDAQQKFHWAAIQADTDPPQKDIQVGDHILSIAGTSNAKPAAVSATFIVALIVCEC